MFGNLKGWLMSLLIVGLTGIVIYFQGVPARPTPPTGRYPQGLQPLALPVDPATILPVGTSDIDAGDLYRRAAEMVQKNSLKYDRFNQKPSLAAAKELEAFDLLLQARPAAKMTLYKNPGEVVNYENSKKYLPELAQLQKIAVNVGTLHFKTSPQKAKEYMEAAFVMGRHLYNERLVFEEYRIGTEAMINAAGMMALFTPDKNDPARVALLKKFVDETSAYQKDKLLPLMTAIVQLPKEGHLLDYPGDVLQIAQSSKEPLWQTESLLKAGRMWRMVGVTPGDKLAARKLLKSMSERTDIPPNVKAAAIAGRDLDQTTFNKIGGAS